MQSLWEGKRPGCRVERRGCFRDATQFMESRGRLPSWFILLLLTFISSPMLRLDLPCVLKMENLPVGFASFDDNSTIDQAAMTNAISKLAEIIEGRWLSILASNDNLEGPYIQIFLVPTCDGDMDTGAAIEDQSVDLEEDDDDIEDID